MSCCIKKKSDSDSLESTIKDVYKSLSHDEKVIHIHKTRVWIWVLVLFILTYINLIVMWTLAYILSGYPAESSFSSMLADPIPGTGDVIRTYYECWLVFYIFASLIILYLIFEDSFMYKNFKKKWWIEKCIKRRHLLIVCNNFYLLFTILKCVGLMLLLIFPCTTYPTLHEIFASIAFVSAILCAYVLFMRRLCIGWFSNEGKCLGKFLLFLNILELITLLVLAILFITLDNGILEYVLTHFIILDWLWMVYMDFYSVTLITNFLEHIDHLKHPSHAELTENQSLDHLFTSPPNIDEGEDGGEEEEEENLLNEKQRIIEENERVRKNLKNSNFLFVIPSSHKKS